MGRTAPVHGCTKPNAGLASGGMVCEDPPGLREGPAGKLYLAYLRDPGGTKLCGLYRVPRG